MTGGPLMACQSCFTVAALSREWLASRPRALTSTTILRVNGVNFIKRRRWWVLCLTLIGVAHLLKVAASSQVSPEPNRDYLIATWTTEDGLPQNSVNDSCQTRDGYLWFTTLDGLVRYDGVRFTIFNKSNSPGMVSNRLISLKEDTDGALWIGTEDAGVMRYAQGVFKVFSTRDGLQHNRVPRIQLTGDGGLHIQTREGHVYWRENRLLPDPENLYPGKARKFFAPSGAIWTLDETGLHCFKDGKTTSYPPLISPFFIRFAPFYEDRQGNLWFGANGSGVFKIKDGAITRYGEKDGLPSNPLEGFVEDRYGAIWIGTIGGGLARLQDGQISLYTKKEGLSDIAIGSLLEDREGNLWIGTNAGGLNRLSRKFITTYSAESGLRDARVYPILQDRSGVIWIGTLGGLTRFADGQFVNLPAESSSSHRFSAQALYEDRAGRLWVGTYGGAGQFINGEYVRDGRIPDIAVFAILEDRHGTFWFGTEKGLFKCNADSCTVYTANNGLPGSDVKAIYEDRQGDLWIGTYGGIARLSNGKFTHYTEREGLTGNSVRYIYEDSDGTFWIGTYDSGLSRFRNGRFTNYAVKSGLYNEGVFQILEDAYGMFWIGCNKGIYHVSKQQLNDYADGKISSIICSAYNQQDGMGNAECNGGRQPSGIRALDGRLWFPTLGGAVVVDPTAAPPNLLPPPVRVESVLVDRNQVNFQDEIRIAPDQKYLEISYAGLSFVKSEQARFRYRLSGQDQDWIDAGTRRVAYFSYLPPGNYTFTVTAANSDGIWNPEGASIRIVVVPPFWRTWWFLTLVSLGVAGTVFLAYRQRIANLQRANAAQEAFSRQLLDSQEQERQRIAAELHDSLGQSLLIIKNRSFLAMDSFDDPEATREQIAEISDASAHAIEEVREIAYNLRPYKMERFGLTKTLQAMCQQAERTSGIRFATELVNIDGLFPKEAELNLYRVVQESVNNILKHSRATEARLTIEQDEREVRMKIEDNGQGFSGASQANAHESRRGGFGLIGMAERVRLLGGAYTMDSAPGQGTTITVKLTIPEKTV